MTRIIIEPITLQRIYSMYEQGFSFKTIATVTGINSRVISLRIYKDGIERKNKLKKVMKPGKYDHLFEETKNPGKDYRDYVKKN